MRRVACLCVLASLVAPAASALAQNGPGSARLQGAFQMSGRVTVARYIKGEHVGDHVLRTWTFTPGCPTGPCATVVLVRQRASGSDRVVLHGRGSGLYAGHGRFYVPLRCGRRTVPLGVEVPFRIKVRITSVATLGGQLVAMQLKARYFNRHRINRTRCVALPGHDTAVYTGQLAGYAVSGSRAARAAEASTRGRSPAGS